MIIKYIDTPAVVNGISTSFDFDTLQKVASDLSPIIQKEVSLIKPEKGYSFALLTAVEASEYWGPNKRGDYFVEKGPSPEYNKLNKQLWGLTLEDKYFGYKTFLNAHFFAHHRNTDPKQSAGKPIKVFYDNIMHRVNLILKINNQKADALGMSDYLQALASGEPIDYSMGCKTPFDISSIEGDFDRIYSFLAKYKNPMEGVKAIIEEHSKHPFKGLARKVSDYEPLRKYHMNEVLADGRQVCNVTTHPVFFDISYVFSGAGAISKNIMKIASAKDEKKVDKLGTFTKTFIAPGNSHPEEKTLSVGLHKITREDKMLPKELLNSFPIEKLIAILSQAGIPLKPEEMFYNKQGPHMRGLIIAGKTRFTLPNKKIINNNISKFHVPVDPNEDYLILQDILRKFPNLLAERSLASRYLKPRLLERITIRKLGSENNINNFIEIPLSLKDWGVYNIYDTWFANVLQH